MKVIGYCRVSTADQEYGIDAQRTKIHAEADARGWDVEWIEDADKSGKDIDRQGISRALAMLKNKQADVLVVAKLDRLSRSLKDFAGLMETAEKQGWAIIALDFGLDMTTPTGEMVANISGAVSRYERRLMGLRTKEALAELNASRLPRPQCERRGTVVSTWVGFASGRGCAPLR